MKEIHNDIGNFLEELPQHNTFIKALKKLTNKVKCSLIEILREQLHIPTYHLLKF